MSARPVLISLLWPKNAHVLALLMQHFGFDIAVADNAMANDLAQIAAGCGGRVLPLSVGIAPGAVAAAAQMAASTGGRLPAIAQAYEPLRPFDPEAIGGVIQATLESRLRDGIALVDALDDLRGRETIAGLIVNETDLPAAKTAALWAKEHAIPSFLLSHGSNLGGAYTITNQMLADYLLVFGERGTEPYLDMGIPPERMIVTGNPAWDGYGTILQSRAEYRSAVFKQLGLNDAAPLVVFATTWNAKLTALMDAQLFENTTRAFVSACKVLHDRGFAFNAVVKDRTSNREFGGRTVAAMIQELGAAGVAYADGDMPLFLCAADLLVSFDSNTFVEAMMAGVPSVGLWEPSGWLLGPALDRRDNLPLVQSSNPEGLADVMQRLLGDPQARVTILAEQTGRLPYFHVASDGRSGERAASAIAETLKKHRPAVPVNGAAAAAQPQRFAWHEMTNPRSVAEKGGTQEYYDHPRHELIALLDHAPRMVLDIGCAGGATALELKKLHPNAVVHGIELSEEAAALAATRMDRILRENVEQMDFSAFGYAHGSLDVVFLPDVLEHLYNPWQLLVKLKPYLSDDAQILASIPNVRNGWLVSQLIAGHWDYVEEGLLDVTHIRFFTLKGVIELFGQTGYAIQRIGQNIDGRMPSVDVPPNGTVSFDMGNATFKNMTAQDVWELRTFQFLIDAKPA